jgi:hypothetical protein
MRTTGQMPKTMLRAIVGVFAFGLLSVSASRLAQTEHVSNNFFGWGLMLHVADPKAFILQQRDDPMAGRQWMNTRPQQDLQDGPL